jgi:hypothetical protein
VIASRLYELIGRGVVRLAWWRYGRQIRLAGLGAGALLIATVWALSRRQPPEG